jgi:tRNA modification GTPase
MIELELDFSEEDVEFANRDQLKSLVMAIFKVINKLVQSFELGNVIKNGVPVVIAGKPNVGKSTLLNVLLNEERAIVSEIAGTTRDTIEDEINIQGINFRFIDTAGIRETQDIVEAKGVERTFEKIKSSAIVLYLFDALETKGTELEEIITDLKTVIEERNGQLIIVCNKVDLGQIEALKTQFAAYPDMLFISAKEQFNINSLEDALLEAVNFKALNSEEVIVSSLRHHDALLKTSASLERVLYGIDNPVTSDFLALDIKQALYYLGEITGQVTTDDLLDNIFSKFCIGK